MLPGAEGEQNKAEAVDNIDATDEMNPVGGEPTDEAPIVVPGEDAEVTVHVSTQHPSEVQHMVSHALGVPANAVTVSVRREASGGKAGDAFWSLIRDLVLVVWS